MPCIASYVIHHLDIKPNVRPSHIYFINPFVTLQTLCMCYNNSEILLFVSVLKKFYICGVIQSELLTPLFIIAPPNVRPSHV